MFKNQKQIKEYKTGDHFTGHLLVRQANEGVTKNGVAYLNTKLGDASGNLPAMVWNLDDAKRHVFKAGQVVYLEGLISEYQGNKQLSIQNIESVDPEDQADIRPHLIQSAPIDGDTLIQMIEQNLLDIENENIKLVTYTLFERLKDKIKTHPAAKSIHHSYQNGLAFHTFSMLEMANQIAKLYPLLDKDLLIAGVILHDLGKTVEYTSGLDNDLTLEGKLKGHISIISEMIHQTACDLGIQDQQEIWLIQHLVLGHHGIVQNGWGSAVSPILIEGHILHLIDQIDANIDTYRSAADQTEPGEFTDRLFGLDNRAFYIPDYKETDTDS